MVVFDLNWGLVLGTHILVWPHLSNQHIFLSAPHPFPSLPFPPYWDSELWHALRPLGFSSYPRGNWKPRVHLRHSLAHIMSFSCSLGLPSLMALSYQHLNMLMSL